MLSACGESPARHSAPETQLPLKFKLKARLFTSQCRTALYRRGVEVQIPCTSLQRVSRTTLDKRTMIVAIASLSDCYESHAPAIQHAFTRAHRDSRMRGWLWGRRRAVEHLERLLESVGRRHAQRRNIVLRVQLVAPTRTHDTDARHHQAPRIKVAHR